MSGHEVNPPKTPGQHPHQHHHGHDKPPVADPTTPGNQVVTNTPADPPTPTTPPAPPADADDE